MTVTMREFTLPRFVVDPDGWKEIGYIDTTRTRKKEGRVCVRRKHLPIESGEIVGILDRKRPSGKFRVIAFACVEKGQMLSTTVKIMFSYDEDNYHPMKIMKIRNHRLVIPSTTNFHNIIDAVA